MRRTHATSSCRGSTRARVQSRPCARRIAAAPATGSDARHASVLRSPVKWRVSAAVLDCAMARTRLQLDADRHARDASPAPGRGPPADARGRGRDARPTIARLAGVDPSVLSRVEAGSLRPTLETYARIAAALGADLAARVYPQTGPRIRDRHQVRMAEVVIASLHPRWQVTPEVAVRSPVRGWIDLALHDPGAQLVVAGELESELRRLEQLIRWSAAEGRRDRGGLAAAGRALDARTTARRSRRRGGCCARPTRPIRAMRSRRSPGPRPGPGPRSSGRGSTAAGPSATCVA